VQGRVVDEGDIKLSQKNKILGKLGEMHPKSMWDLGITQTSVSVFYSFTRLCWFVLWFGIFQTPLSFFSSLSHQFSFFLPLILFPGMDRTVTLFLFVLTQEWARGAMRATLTLPYASHCLDAVTPYLIPSKVDVIVLVSQRLRENTAQDHRASRILI
jgi:hypothetical protein